MGLRSHQHVEFSALSFEASSVTPEKVVHFAFAVWSAVLTVLAIILATPPSVCATGLEQVPFSEKRQRTAENEYGGRLINPSASPAGRRLRA